MIFPWLIGENQLHMFHLPDPAGRFAASWWDWNLEGWNWEKVTGRPSGPGGAARRGTEHIKLKRTQSGFPPPNNKGLCIDLSFIDNSDLHACTEKHMRRNGDTAECTQRLLSLSHTLPWLDLATYSHCPLWLESGFKQTKDYRQYYIFKKLVYIVFGSVPQV